MSRFNDDDRRQMWRALQLAARGQGAVEPNPMVGCVLVRNGRIIGEGWHRRFGGPHAEVDALRHCTGAPRGATAYVSLEPCNHHGKTPPCVEALLDAGIGRVVAPLVDPNPQVAGRGFAALRGAGVRVDVGLLHAEAAALNAPFIKRLSTGRPWVIVKWAQSLDGKIASRTGDSKWITDEACRNHAHRTRGRVDAIMVGVQTVRRDDPQLTCRVGRVRRVATRVVLDTHLRTPTDARVVRTARHTPTWIFCGRNAPAARVRRFEKAGCRVSPVVTRGGRVSLDAVLDALGGASMTNVLVEGGGRLLGVLFDARLADEAHVYVAPLLLGGTEALGALHGVGVARVADALKLRDARIRGVGNGWFISGRFDQAT